MQHLKSQGPSRELEWAEALKVKGNLYLSHVGSNDDWYWLYAVVAAKGAGLLVRRGGSECASGWHPLEASHWWRLARERGCALSVHCMAIARALCILSDYAELALQAGPCRQGCVASCGMHQALPCPCVMPHLLFLPLLLTHAGQQRPAARPRVEPAARQALPQMARASHH